MSYTTTYQQGYQSYSSYRQPPQEYSEFKLQFRPIHKHVCYPKIKDSLYQLQKTRDIGLITQILTEFKFLTKQQSSLQEWMDKQRKHNEEYETFFQRILKSLSNILSSASQVLKYLEFKEKNIRNEYMSSKNKDNFIALKSLYKRNNDFVCQTIGLMAKYVLDCEQTSQISKIQICYSQDNECHKYTKNQVVYLMCLMVLNLVPNQYYHKSYKYNKWFNFNNNFSYIFNHQELKTQVILTYFAEFSNLNQLNINTFNRQNKNYHINNINNKQIYDNSKKNQYQNNKTNKHNIFSNQNKFQDKYKKYPVKQNFKDESLQLFTIQRKCATKKQIDNILDSQIKMGSYIFISDNQTMESYIQENNYNSQKYNSKRQISNLYPKSKKQKVKVDFANKYISGGALAGGMVQQEIIYMSHPQLFVTVIICQSMNHNQSLCYSGFPKYFKNDGYGKNIKAFYKQSPDMQLLSFYILAIDAEDYSNYGLNQFSKASVDRQILKAYSGFSNTNKNAQIVTGNWGCGVFQGNHQLKFMIQWIAGSLAGKQMVHCPYGQENKIFLSLDRKEFMHKMSRKTIDQVIRMVYKGIQIVLRKRNELIYVLDELLNEQIERQRGNNEQNQRFIQNKNKPYQFTNNNSWHNSIENNQRKKIYNGNNNEQQIDKRYQNKADDNKQQNNMNKEQNQFKYNYNSNENSVHTRNKNNQLNKQKQTNNAIKSNYQQQNNVKQNKFNLNSQNRFTINNNNNQSNIKIQQHNLLSSKNNNRFKPTHNTNTNSIPFKKNSFK